MKNKDEVKLDEAVAAVREEEVDLRVAESARGRVWERLSRGAGSVGTIRSCGDVRALLGAHAAGTLSPARALLVEDHLHECAACRAAVKGNEAAVAPWSASLSPGHKRWSWRHAAAAAAALALGVTGYAARDRLLGIPDGPRAEVQSIAGTLYRVADGAPTALRPGDALGEGEAVRAGRGAQATLRLRDGSVVEMGEHAELSMTARRNDTTLHLARGSVIVQAAKRRTGHLYVASSDCTVAVTGTVFSVSRGVKGSRVAVAEGEVRVRQSAQEHVLRPGQQFASTASLQRVPIRDEFSWSRNAVVLAELSKLRHDLERVTMPDTRYESRLLRGVPAGAVVYVAAPNYGPSLGQAHALLEERMQKSAVLRQWWQQNGPRGKGAPVFAELVAKMQRLGEHLGDEVVMAFVPRTDRARDRHHVLFLAEPRSSGLRSFLESELFAGQVKAPRLLFVTNPAAMPAGRPTSTSSCAAISWRRAAIAPRCARPPAPSTARPPGWTTVRSDAASQRPIVTAPASSWPPMRPTLRGRGTLPPRSVSATCSTSSPSARRWTAGPATRPSCRSPARVAACPPGWARPLHGVAGVRLAGCRRGRRLRHQEPGPGVRRHLELPGGPRPGPARAGGGGVAGAPAASRGPGGGPR